MKKLKSIEVERMILGCCLADGSSFRKVSRFVNETDFSSEINSSIFSVFKKMDKRGIRIDLPLAFEFCSKNNIDVDLNFLMELSESVERLDNIEYYGMEVLDKSIKRDLNINLQDFLLRIVDNRGFSYDILEDLEKLSVNHKIRLSRLKIKDKTQTLTEVFDEIQNPENSNHFPFCGISDFDKKLKLKKQCLTIIAARPSMGKSFFANTVLSYVSYIRGLNVLIFNLEMSDKQSIKRFLSCVGPMDFNQILDGRVSSIEPLSDAYDFLKKDKITWIDKTNLTALDIRNKTIEVQPDLVIVDHGGLMNHNLIEGSMTDKIGESTKQLKRLAKEMDMPVICLWQLNRGNTSRVDKRPSLSDLRGSGRIEEDADQVIFIHRPGYYDKDEGSDKSYTEIFVDKNRDGETFMQKMNFNPDYARFEEISEDYIYHNNEVIF